MGRDDEKEPLGGFTEPKRADVVRAALAEQAAHGDAPRIPVYWASAGVAAPYPRHWCGAFALWALHEAGLGTDQLWEFGPMPQREGLGFVMPAGLAQTYDPKPGDVYYQDQPWQHHAIVVSVDGDTLTTVDGNSPGISVTKRRLGTGRVYSIERWL